MATSMPRGSNAGGRFSKGNPGRELGREQARRIGWPWGANCNRRGGSYKAKTLSRPAPWGGPGETHHSTVTLFARLRGLSTSQPRKSAM